MGRSFGAISLVSLSTLMMEIVLLRAFDVILVPNMSYMIITLAMFAFALSGIYITLKPAIIENNIKKSLAIVTALFAFSALGVLPTMNLLPFDYRQLYNAPIVQSVSFLAMYLALIIPFFFSGMVFSMIFSVLSENIQTLYFWDLGGAALGCIVFVPFMSLIGPGGLLFCVSSIALIASGIFSPSRMWSIIAISIAAFLLAMPFIYSPKYFDFKEHLDKSGVKEARRLGKIELTRWDPISKIDVIDLNDIASISDPALYGTRGKFIAYDGGTQQSIICQFNGDFQGFRLKSLKSIDKCCWQPEIFASHYLKRDTNYRTLIIGSGGGRETMAALTYGAGHIDCIELVKTVVDLGKEKYAKYNGGIFTNPKVTVRVDEGRSVLRGSKVKYDIIQMYSNYTSSSIASGSGAIAANYLQTVEAYMEYFQHLKHDGILHINHFIYPKIVATAGVAWKRLGRTEFRKHVLVFTKEKQRDNQPTIMIKMVPWTQEEVDEMRRLFSLSPVHYQLVEDPLHPEKSFLSSAFYSGNIEKLRQLDKKLKFRMLPATDDKPYFMFLRKKIGLVQPDPSHFMNLTTATVLNSQMKKIIPMDTVNLFITGVAALVFSVVFIFVPLFFSEVGKTKWPKKGVSLGYFACLGAGFIIIELVFIQIFMLFIGFPLYAYSTVIFSLLLGSSLGSLTSQRLGISPIRLWWVPFIGVLALGFVFLVSHSYIFHSFISQPTLVRILVSSLMILPVGFFMGIPFPLGILVAKDFPRGVIAWAWSMNGCFTLVGGIANSVFCLFEGFRCTFGLALILYAVALFLFSKFRSIPALERRMSESEPR